MATIQVASGSPGRVGGGCVKGEGVCGAKGEEREGRGSWSGGLGRDGGR